MAIAVLKRFEDFKTLQKDSGLMVFYKIDPTTEDLLLYLSSEIVYCVRVVKSKLKQSKLEDFLISNFGENNFMEVRDLFD